MEGGKGDRQLPLLLIGEMGGRKGNGRGEEEGRM